MWLYRHTYSNTHFQHLIWYPSRVSHPLQKCWYDISPEQGLPLFVSLIWDNNWFQKTKKTTTIVWVMQGDTHTHTHKCGRWPKWLLWVKDKKKHFSLGSNVFVAVPGLPPVLCHDSCPSIRSHQSYISAPPWLHFKSQHHTLCSCEKGNAKLKGSLLPWDADSFDYAGLHSTTYAFWTDTRTRIHTHTNRRLQNICQQAASTGTLDCFSALPKGAALFSFSASHSSRHYFFRSDSATFLKVCSHVALPLQSPATAVFHQPHSLINILMPEFKSRDFLGSPVEKTSTSALIMHATSQHRSSHSLWCYSAPTYHTGNLWS